MLSVGAEPTGAPGGGPRARRRAGRLPPAARRTSSSGGGAATSRSSTAIPTGRSWSRGSTRGWSACTRRSSRSPTGGSERAAHRSSTTPTLRRVSCLPAPTSGDGSVSELAACPDWTRLCPAPATHPADHAPPRSGDRAAAGGGAARRSLRFSSLARPATVALRAQANPAVVVSPRRRRAHQAVAAALRDRRHGHVLERLGAYDPEEAVRRQALARRASRRGLRTAPRASTGRHGRSAGREADVVIEGDPELQRAVRFALFHLMASVGDAGEAAVGARGLTGRALPRPRLLGQRRVRPALPRRHASARPRGRCSSTACAGCPPRASRRERSAGAGARFPGSRPRDGSDVTPALGTTRDRRARPDPHG